MSSMRFMRVVNAVKCTERMYNTGHIISPIHMCLHIHHAILCCARACAYKEVCISAWTHDSAERNLFLNLPSFKKTQADFFCKLVKQSPTRSRNSTTCSAKRIT